MEVLDLTTGWFGNSRPHYLPRNLDKLSDIDRAAVLDAQLRLIEEEEQRGVPEANRARQKRNLQARKRRLIKTANAYGLWLDDDQQAT